VLLTFVVLVQRACTAAWGLPHLQDSDPHLIGSQLQIFREQPYFLDARGELDRDALFNSSIYPHLIGRLTHAASLLAARPEPEPRSPLAEHLRAAGRDVRLTRLVVAVLSALVVPGSFALARAFVGGWWGLFAAALAGFGLLGLQFGTAARPHAAASALVACGLAACVRLRREPTTRNLAWAGVWTALALGALQNALPVLLSGLAAWVLRSGPRRSRIDVRLLLPLGMCAASVACFWPFAFVARTSGTSAFEWTSGGLAVSDQRIWFADFSGLGTLEVLRTFWHYEPLTALLASAACAAWCLGVARRKEVGSSAPDLAVVAAYSLPYLAVLCAFDKTMQRFVLPLVPVLACLAAWLLREWSRRSRPTRALACALATLALALPVTAGARWILLRTRPDTLTSAADWLRANVDPVRTRIGILSTYDLPLARRVENLPGEHGLSEGMGYSPWVAYQARCLARAPEWEGERWALFPLLGPSRPDPARDPTEFDRYMGQLTPDYLLLPSAKEASASEPIRQLHAWALARGALVARSPHSQGGPWSGRGWTDLDSHFLWQALVARAVGPGWELVRLNRP
jgi:hypothetical protein